MATTVTIRVRGLMDAQRHINRITGRLQDPHDGLIKATNRVADVFRTNYDGEGSLVGGWPELAEMTQNIREYQGFSPSNPILIRYGALRAVAVEFFQHANGDGSTSEGDDYSDQVVQGSLSIHRNVATMQVGGSYKVLNQWGHANAKTGPNPPRPFWFVDRHSVAAAKDGLKDWIENDVLKGY